MKLEEIQKSFLEGIQTEKTSHLNLNQNSHFDAYKNSYVGTLKKTLQKTFPVLEDLIGHDFFDNCSAKFIKQNFSKSNDLNLYGTNFPAYFSKLIDLPDYPYLGDMAHLELYYHQVLLKTNEMTLDVADLSSIGDFDKIMFLINPSFIVMSSNFPLDKIWLYNIQKLDDDLNIKTGNYNFIIYKSNAKVYILSLSDIEILLLNHIISQNNIEDILRESDDFIPVFQKFLQNGIINNYRRLP